MNKSFLIWGLCLFFALTSCQDKEDDACLEEVDISNIKVDVSIDRFDKALFACKSAEEIEKLLDSKPVLSEQYFNRSEFKTKGELSSILYKMVADTSLNALASEVNASYGDMNGLKKEFEEVFARVKYFYPRFKIPKVMTFVSGYAKGSDVFVSDDLVVIGLEFFMGPKYKYQPSEPLYISRRYKRAAIVPFVLRAISAKYMHADPRDQSAIAQMIIYGKSYYFIQKMMHCYPDSSVLGYTSKQMQDVNKNKALIWNHYIDHGILFESNHLRVKDYIEEGPFTLPINQEWCPGAIGRWTGLRIVKQYMNRNPDIALPQLMNNVDTKAIFEASKYKGQ